MERTTFLVVAVIGESERYTLIYFVNWKLQSKIASQRISAIFTGPISKIINSISP